MRRLVESLSEAEDDKIVLVKNNDMLRFENEHLQKHRVDTIAEVKKLSDTLEDAEDNKVGLSRSIDKLNDENNRLLKKLADSRRTVKEMKSHISTEHLDKLSLANAMLASELTEIKERLDRHKSSASAKNLAKLKVENLRQEKELAHAREQLSLIKPTVDSETLRELGEDKKRLEEELTCANTTLDHLRAFLAHLATITAAYADWPANFATNECGIANPNSMGCQWVEVANHAADAKPSSPGGDIEIAPTSVNFWRPDAPAFVPPSMVNDNTGSGSFPEPTSSAANVIKAD